MSDAERTIEERLLVDALKAQEMSYAEASDVWRCLESKAQSTFTISGVFLTATLAISNLAPQASNDCLSILVKSLVVTAILLFIASVLIAVGTLRVRHVAPPPYEKSADHIEELLDSGKSLDDKELRSYLRRRYRDWRTPNAGIDKANESKGDWLSWSQVALVAAIVVATAALTIRITACS